MEQRLQLPHPGLGADLRAVPRCGGKPAPAARRRGPGCGQRRPTESAIASEWKRYGLARHADVIFGQEVGSKANSIATMLACGYESRKVLMVGDSMGDAQAAAANGVAFVPILPGREADSWRRLQEEALPKSLHGTFSPEYQARTAGRSAQCPARVIDYIILLNASPL